MSALIRTTLSATSAQLEPGEHTDLVLTVQNYSEIVDHYQIAVTGVDPSWVTVSRSTVALFPKDEDRVNITIQPPAGPQTRGGHYGLRIEVSSRENPSEQTVETFALDVAILPRLTAVLRPQRATGVAGGDFRLQLTNAGNADLSVQLEGLDPEEALHYVFSPASLIVPAGQERPVALRVQPKAALRGAEARTYPFTITARPEGTPEAACQVQGEWVHVLPSFELALRPSRVTGTAEGAFTLTVSNGGSDDLSVGFEGADPAQACSFSFVPPQVLVRPGQEQAVQLKVRSVAPLSGSAAQVHAFTVTARPRDAPQAARQAQGEWEQTLPTFELALRPPRVSGGGEGRFTLYISNPGSTDLTVQVEARDAQGACTFALSPATVAVPAGQERPVQIVVRPPAAPAGGLAQVRPFTVTARPVEAPGLTRQVQGEWEQAPPTFELALRPLKARGSAEGRFTLHVSNPGSADLTVQFEAPPAPGTCTMAVNPPVVTVPAGQERSVQLRVRPLAALAGMEVRAHVFSVVARAAEAPGLTRQVQGEWAQVLPATAAWRIWGALLLSILAWPLAHVVAIALRESFRWNYGMEIGESIVMAAGSPELGRFVSEWLLPYILFGVVLGLLGGLAAALPARWAGPELRGGGTWSVFIGWFLCLFLSQTLLGCLYALSVDAFGSPVAQGIYGALIGLVGGGLTGRALRRVLPDVSTFVVALAWAAGWGVGSLLVTWWALAPDALPWPFLEWLAGMGLGDPGHAGMLFLVAILGLIIGVVGGAGTIWQIGQARRKMPAPLR